MLTSRSQSVQTSENFADCGRQKQSATYTKQIFRLIGSSRVASVYGRHHLNQHELAYNCCFHVSLYCEVLCKSEYFLIQQFYHLCFVYIHLNDFFDYLLTSVLSTNLRTLLVRVLLCNSLHFALSTVYVGKTFPTFYCFT